MRVTGPTAVALLVLVVFAPAPPSLNRPAATSASWDPQYECGSNYYLTIDGYECTSPVRETSWGSIKSLYR